MNAARGLSAELVDQEPVAQASVAHRQGLLAQLLHDCPDDAGAGQDDVGAPASPTVLSASAGARAPVVLDLVVDLGPAEDRALDGVGVVVCRPGRRRP